MQRGSPLPTHRADWFAARALQASRRLRPFAPVGVLVFVLAFAAVLVRPEHILGTSLVVAVPAVLVLAGVVVFTLAVVIEARRPTVAHAREVERITGVPALGTAFSRHLVREGSARLRPGAGLDPLRTVYLALTARGTGARTVCVTGDDPDLVAAVAARLGMSAASDERATLVVDAAPGTAAVTRYFGERHEPGFSEAIAAVRLWREVARPVGASEALGLDVVPAGARRADTAASVAIESNRHEFQLFASEYDFTVIAAPTKGSLASAEMLFERPPTIYVARVARTLLGTLIGEVRDLQQMNLELYGVLLIDSRL